MRVTVSDNGCGIAPALLPGVFDLFTQGQRGRDRTQGGLGIGLAIVHGLVRMHGGRVAAHSDGPGQGARFEVTLPLARTPGTEPAPPRGVPGRPGASARPPPGTTVLVVDDNRDAADTLAALLQSQGVQCSIEYGAAAGLQRALRERPRVCILDIGLPEMDGCELARQLRAALEGPLLLVAQSGYGQVHDRAAGLAAGFDYYFVKPVAADTLLAVLADALQPGAAPAALATP
ncbi:hybrid sensor histidine kinase/response regulator [Pseudoduganella chitinolytica]|uniref:histidine kinase n=1 Tax=Pseudoduganella chitinolytica TaxID=34070 RepID=A0ABY8BFE2_9BURK|nr:hybrid sensor histidine kinase/response regulator [Pseudoduganella chitinolytica]WEF34619.1 hybrid sensor histidine kinase/response regulator [Pseudoduganella chitinolytica]